MKWKRLTHSGLAKGVAVFLLVLMACTTFLSILGGIFLTENDLYQKPTAKVKQEVMENMAQSDATEALSVILSDGKQGIEETYGETNLMFEFFNMWGGTIGSNYNGNQNVISYQFSCVPPKEYATYETEAPEKPIEYTVKVYLDRNFPKQDAYAWTDQMVDILYSLRYAVIVIGVTAFLIGIGLFVFLLCAAGHRVGEEEVVANQLDRIPLDVYAALVGAGLLSMGSIAFSWYYSYWNLFLISSLYGSFLILGGLLLLAFCMSFATRVKLGGWWRNTIIYRLLILLRKGARKVRDNMEYLISNVPLIWKTGLILGGICLFEFIGLFLFYFNSRILLFLWVLEKLVLVPAVLYLALMLRRLQKGGEMLAEGDLSYQVDTTRMFGDFRTHGVHLNQIAEGLNHAVEERMKSERLKTELITNVSHDIKTPLTSIINYVDLISKEKSENQSITEYTAVLKRQSERLKKLIEDLVEASKASTGNIEVLLTPCEVGVLLAQTTGEYEQRVMDGGLKLISHQPKFPVKIMADGRLLWRVFDNLMNNICKYAQQGTRVYLDVDQKNGVVQISFKNTSQYQLNISSEELMERFVRGDSARNTEGSGLGLSIAQSLTELQGGSLELMVDGDLFKVTLTFQAMK